MNETSLNYLYLSAVFQWVWTLSLMLKVYLLEKEIKRGKK